MEEQQSFWEGFPMLAGAINTAPLIPEWAGLIQLDQAPSAESGGGQLDEHWDLGLLGISQGPVM